MTRGISVLLASMAALGCGGKSLTSDPQAFGGAAPIASGQISSGGAASAEVGGANAGFGVTGSGNGSAGGSGTSNLAASGSSDLGSAGADTAGIAGAADTAPCSTNGNPPFQCVTSCGVQEPPVRSPVCDGQQWRCPGSLQNVLDCAPDSCAVRAQTCCDPELGNISSLCGADGRVAPCAPGQIANITICAPAMRSCSSLQGQPCTLLNLGCDDGSRTACSCQPTNAGLAWACSVIPG
jgi:hypothetical protein